MMWRCVSAAALVMGCAAIAGAGESVPEPDGYRLENGRRTPTAVAALTED